VPMNDIADTVVEIRRAHGEGLRGIMIPPLAAPGYNDKMYDPVWAVCQELDMPVHTHTGIAPFREYGTDSDIGMIETIWWTHRPLWFMLITGVFERFPRLKAAVAEGGCWWVPDMLWKWDTAYLREHATKKLARIAPNLSMLPSEYFDRNVCIGASNLRRRELMKRYEIGVGNIMWGNDFPHSEGTWPNTKKWLRESLWDIPVDETRQMLGLNAAEFYNFDVQALAPLVEQIGPRPSDLGQSSGVDRSKWDPLREVGRHWITDPARVPSDIPA
jgi:predicted TIM-barrel fold metal-dependent hydrolase